MKLVIALRKQLAFFFKFIGRYNLSRWNRFKCPNDKSGRQMYLLKIYFTHSRNNGLDEIQ